MTHIYSILNDTLNGLADSYSLDCEIKASDITIAIDYVSTMNDVLTVQFKAALSAEETTTLNSLVANHTGAKSNEPNQIEVTNQLTIAEEPAFTAKTLPNGKKLYSRITGKKFAVTTGANTLEYVVTHPQVKFNELEILGGELGDTVDLKILDTPAGSYSTVPDYLFNQFGFDVNVSKDYYHRASSYDADLYAGMRIVIEFESATDKNICVNYVIHEVKD